MKLHHTILAFAVIVTSSAMLQARTIEWGNAVGDTVVNSQGVALDATYIFELGSFGSFVPNELNLDLWAANWKAFDRAVAPELDGWDSVLGFFSSSATLEGDFTSSESPPLPSYTFAEGEQAYIWVYNGLSIDALTEWALVTNNSLDGNSADDWLFPAPGGKTDMPLEWRLSNASNVGFGGLNDEEGPGGYTVDPGFFALQTHTVPEPSGMLLVLAAAAFGMARNRRK